MKKLLLFGLVVLVAGMLAGGEVRAGEPPGGQGVAQVPLGTAFTYQGFLKQAGSPVSGTCDLQFSLWDDGSAGTQAGSTLTSGGVGVGNGLFTVSLDFGASPFDGQARWLGTSVRCPAGAGEYTPLAPRQALTAAPYALYATGAGTAASAASATTAGSAPWSGLTGVPAGFADGVDDVGWSLSGNAGTSSANFLGTTDNMPLVLRVGGGGGLRLEPNEFNIPNLIGGVGNMVTSGVIGATIGGGGGVGSITTNSNIVTDWWGTVSGGRANRTGDDAGTTDDSVYAT
ncbi:MAG TPA: hypothetical protein VJO15_07840, partial [Dehalococcoidia bacterium]|nr:hypothetical protein [Dehalococcoidia bacterium]